MEGAVAIGYLAKAKKKYSMALGEGVITDANFSSGLGFDLTTDSYGQLVLGAYNRTRAGQSKIGRQESDDLLVVGNGNGVVGDSKRFNNALVIRKSGLILIPESGDLPMGGFKAGPAPNNENGSGQ